MSNVLYKKHNYIRKDISFIKKSLITEYDMVNAGINILLTKKLISEEFVNKLNKMNKLDKNVRVGKILQNNPSWNKIMMDEFISIRKYFMEVNDINDDDILSIKKDALFLINKCPKKLKLTRNYTFKEKDSYDYYLNIIRKEFYIDSKESKYDVKNFSNTVLEKQEEYFINFIINTVLLTENRKELYTHIKNFRRKYLSRELEDNYYYDLDDDGYLFKSDNSNFLISSKFMIDKSSCRLEGNYRYLEELIRILL